MNKYIIKTDAEWTGMSLEYAAYADYDDDLYQLAEELAYTNFLSFGGIEYILEDLYPDTEVYEEDMYDNAYSVSGDYYWYTIKLAENEDLGHFDSLELVYDGRTS